VATLDRVNDRTGVARFVLGILGGICPERVADAGLADDMQLGSDGLGLDSVELAELLLGCEDRYGIPVDGLLELRSLTFGRVVDHFAAG
jgi:acyl carrier protein